MSARSVSRLWLNGGQYTAAAATTGDYPGTLGYITNPRPTNITAGQSTDTFSDSVGPSLTKPTATTATQLIVIEKPLCSLNQGGRVKPIVNTTAYNLNPDGTSNDNSAFPGIAYPFPDGAEVNDATGIAAGNAGQYVYSMAKLNQPIYILPGQTFENKFIPLSGVTGVTQVVTVDGNVVIPGDSVTSFTTFSVYDGPDALIASKLIEMGYPISMSNVDWYKRQLLSEAGGASQ
jgi:hypothetical protein